MRGWIVNVCGEAQSRTQERNHETGTNVVDETQRYCDILQRAEPKTCAQPSSGYLEKQHNHDLPPPTKAKKNRLMIFDGKNERRRRLFSNDVLQYIWFSFFFPFQDASPMSRLGGGAGAGPEGKESRHEGKLEKRSPSGLRLFQDRVFVLDKASGLLSYYKSEKDVAKNATAGKFTLALAFARSSQTEISCLGFRRAGRSSRVSYRC